MRRVSLNARVAFDQQSANPVEVALFQIEHPSLDAPVRLSTDPTERLSADPAVTYGTRSAWLGANPVTEPFQFILASAEVPSDVEDAPAAANIILENVDRDIASLLRSFTDQPVVHMAIVLAESPDFPEVQYLGLRMISADGNAGEITLSISRAPIEDETAPTIRFTKDRFPGLFL